MDGLFELLILAVFILAPMIDAIKRRSKKGREDGPVDPVESERTSTTTRRNTGADRERSAEELVPADLWAVLTGQKLPEARRELPDVHRGSDVEEEPESYDDLAEEPERAEPWKGREPAATQPSASGPSADERSEWAASDPVGDHSWSEIGGRGEIGKGDLPDRTQEMDELGGFMAGRSLRRAGRSLDRAARLGGGMSGTAGVTGGARGTGSLGSGLTDAGSGAHPFFDDLDRDDLRRAIVLNEVLGPPLSLRDPPMEVEMP